MKTRASVLKENIIKFGHPDTIVTNNFPRDYQRAGLSFDMIVADVPCSGEGMFRKDAGAIAEWSPGNVEKCWQLQRSIIEDIWPCLRAGGVLIYSTCTFNAHEDEENVAWIATTLGADFVELKTRPEWNITGPLTGSSPCYRFIPGRTRGGGSSWRCSGSAATIPAVAPSPFPASGKAVSRARLHGMSMRRFGWMVTS